MTPEKLFQQMLVLGSDWEVIDCRFQEEDGLVSLEIRETPNLFGRLKCSKCSGKLVCHDHTEVLEWRHLNVFEHRCDIRCRLPRSKCAHCREVHRVTPPWEGLSKHFTQAFEAYVLLLAREMPMARVARLVGESDTRLWRMIHTHVQGARAKADFSQVTCVGVDEMSIRKGRQYLSVFADLVGKRVLFGTPGRDASVFAEFVKDLGEHNGHPHAILEMSMDMSKPYQKGVAEHCRNAQVVFDKYHVIANVSAAVDQVRKTESIGPSNRTLRRTMWIWRKNPENLTDQQRDRLEKLNGENLWTAKAYQLRLSLQEIYRGEDVKTARQSLSDWCQLVRGVACEAPGTMFAAMRRVARMMETHMEGIMAHWGHRITNAFMEGLNSVFSATKRKARGYRSTSYLLAMLYLTSAKLKLPHPAH